MERKEQKKKFLLLQVNDALFPIGGYSHSYGLETYIQKELVADTDTAWEFLKRRLCHGLCYNELLTVRLAYQYAEEGDLEKLQGLEELLEASRLPREIRDAGKKLGSRFAKTLEKLEIDYESDIFTNYCHMRKGAGMVHACAYGVFCAAGGIPRKDALEQYLYAQASAMVTNCVKTIPLSQTDGQKLLYRSEDLFHGLLEAVERLDPEDLCRSAPGSDIRCMQHEGLYSRIYMS